MSLVSQHRALRTEQLNALLLVAAMIFVLPLLRVHQRFDPHDGTRLSIKLNLLCHKEPRTLESVFDHVLEVMPAPRVVVAQAACVGIQPTWTERLPDTVFDSAPQAPRGPPPSFPVIL